MPKTDVSVGVDYLMDVLFWSNFLKSHPKFEPSLRVVLHELFELRYKVRNYEKGDSNGK